MVIILQSFLILINCSLENWLDRCMFLFIVLKFVFILNKIFLILTVHYFNHDYYFYISNLLNSLSQNLFYYIRNIE